MQLIHLTNFGFLSVTGRDAYKFLQGYTTCDLGPVSQGTAAIGAICNLQGRMVTSFRVSRYQDGLLLRMDRSLVPLTLEFLSKYIVFSKAEMSDMSASYQCLGSMGEPDIATIDAENILVPVGKDRQEIWSDTLTPTETDSNDWQLAEIADGLVWVNELLSEQYLPQMFNYHQLDAIDFEKGCYLGQEIVARMQYRGELKRRLHRGTGTASVGAALENANGKSIGEVVRAHRDQLLAVIQNTDDTVEANGITFSLV